MGASCLSIFGYADKPVMPLAAPQQQNQWPVSFDTLTHHITANFPIPSREIQQENRSNHLYLAQRMSEPNKNGKTFRETFSLVYQEQPLFSSAETSSKAIDLANQFEESLKKHAGIHVAAVAVNHAPKAAGKLDQHYRVLEVTDGSFTDYFVLRVIRTSDGAVVAVHTLQKDETSPMDWNSGHIWEFLDSLVMKNHS